VSVSNYCISQGSVATYLRCGGNYYTWFVSNFFLFTAVQEFLKSVKIWQNYRQSSGSQFFLGGHSVWLRAYNNWWRPSVRERWAHPEWGDFINHWSLTAMVGLFDLISARPYNGICMWICFVISGTRMQHDCKVWGCCRSRPMRSCTLRAIFCQDMLAWCHDSENTRTEMSEPAAHELTWFGGE